MPFTSEDIDKLKKDRDAALEKKDFARAAEKIITLRWKSSKKSFTLVPAAVPEGFNLIHHTIYFRELENYLVLEGSTQVPDETSDNGDTKSIFVVQIFSKVGSKTMIFNCGFEVVFDLKKIEFLVLILILIFLFFTLTFRFIYFFR